MSSKRDGAHRNRRLAKSLTKTKPVPPTPIIEECPISTHRRDATKDTLIWESHSRTPITGVRVISVESNRTMIMPKAPALRSGSAGRSRPSPTVHPKNLSVFEKLLCPVQTASPAVYSLTALPVIHLNTKTLHRVSGILFSASASRLQRPGSSSEN